LKIAAREDKWRTQEEMVDFYHGLDAYICASRTEGGPHPLLEAAACGIPLISTRVGIAPELIRQYENGILVDRTVDEIRKAIVLMRDNQEMRREMGIRAREIIETGWTWDRQAVKYIPFFDYALKKTR
jgi:glycosyltransferase involved in cell wall biosynthesis